MALAAITRVLLPLLPAGSESPHVSERKCILLVAKLAEAGNTEGAQTVLSEMEAAGVRVHDETYRTTSSPRASTPPSPPSRPL